MDDGRDAEPSGVGAVAPEDLDWRQVAELVGHSVHERPAVVVRRDRPRRGRVLEYRFVDGPRIFVKTYLASDDGHRAFGALNDLWGDTFGSGSPRQVPRPHAYQPARRALVTDAAEGRCLTDLASGPGAEWERAVREFAGWLAQLHGTRPPRLRPPIAEEQRGVRLQRRIDDVLRRRPDAAGVVAEMTDALSALGPADGTPAVWVHGRYRPEHVFLTGTVVTVIDLDRSTLADPAGDVGEFVYRLRAVLSRSRAGPVAEDRAVTTFLRAYAEHGGCALPTLAYHWSFAVVWTMLGALVKDRSAKRLTYYRRELRQIPGLVQELT